MLILTRVKFVFNRQINKNIKIMSVIHPQAMHNRLHTPATTHGGH